MTKKLTVFVEGNTKLVFIERLILEIAGYQNISIDRQEFYGGQYLELYGTGSRSGNEKFHALVINCACDGKVKPAILERKDALIAQGYKTILGVRDLHPEFNKNEITKLDKALKVEANDGITIEIILAVLEIEAWFLKEWMHLEKLDASMTLSSILEVTGYDLATCPAEDLPHPAYLLDQIYRIAGMRYRKNDSDAHRTAEAIDYVRLYEVTRNEVPALNKLMTRFDEFLQ